VENVLSIDEYKVTRAKMLTEKTVLKEKQGQLEKNPSYWLEPTERFVKACRQPL
jgi:hypothetical protein